MSYFSVKNLGIALLFFMLGVVSNVSNLFRKNLSTSHVKKEEIKNHTVISTSSNQEEKKVAEKRLSRTKKTFYPTGLLKEEVIESNFETFNSKLNLGMINHTDSVTEIKKVEEIKMTYQPNWLLGISLLPSLNFKSFNYESVEVMGGWRPVGNLWLFASINPTEVVNLIRGQQGHIESVARIGTFYLF